MKFKQFVLFFLLLLPFASLFGQEIPVPSDWQDLYQNYGLFLATAGGVAGIAMFVGEIIVRLLNLAIKWQKVAIVWVLAIVASVVGNYVLNVGYLGEAIWWETLVWGAFSGLLANGIWSSNTGFIKSILEFVINLIKSKQEVPVE
jgi:hypothetical protein